MRCCSLLLLALAVGATFAAAQDALDGPKWISVADAAESKNDTTLVWSLIQAAGLEEALGENLTATVFLPTDEFLQPIVDANPNLADNQAELQRILSYHVVPGMVMSLDELVDGTSLQTLLDGPEGVLMVKKNPNALKPSLMTTSGETFPIYQYDITAGDSIAHTIKGVLMPGTQYFAEAPAPAMMM